MVYCDFREEKEKASIPCGLGCNPLGILRFSRRKADSSISARKRSAQGIGVLRASGETLNTTATRRKIPIPTDTEISAEGFDHSDLYAKLRGN